MNTNFDLWFEKNFNEHGGGETTEDVARKAYSAGYDDGSMHNHLDQAMRNGQLANERAEIIKSMRAALDGADQALRKLQDFKKVHEACIGVIPQLVNEAIDLLTNKTAAVAGVPAVVDWKDRARRFIKEFGSTDADLPVWAVEGALIRTFTPTNTSPLPQADMPRDATEGVMSATVDAAVSAYGSAPFDPQDADPHRTAIDSAVAAAERVRAGSTAVSAGEALRDRCARCGGSGFIDIGYGRHSECPHCHGIGSIARPAAPDMKSKDAVAQGEAVAYIFEHPGNPSDRYLVWPNDATDFRADGYDEKPLHLSPPPSTGSDGQGVMDRAIRHLRRNYFGSNPANTHLAIIFNELLKVNGTYESGLSANSKREDAAK